MAVGISSGSFTSRLRSSGCEPRWNSIDPRVDHVVSMPPSISTNSAPMRSLRPNGRVLPSPSSASAFSTMVTRSSGASSPIASRSASWAAKNCCTSLAALRAMSRSIWPSLSIPSTHCRNVGPISAETPNRWPMTSTGSSCAKSRAPSTSSRSPMSSSRRSAMATTVGSSSSVAFGLKDGSSGRRTGPCSGGSSVIGDRSSLMLSG